MHWVLANILLGLICSVVFVVNLSSQSRASSSVLAWLAIIFFFPIIGVPLYFIFGGRKLKGIVKKKRFLYINKKVSSRAQSNAIEKILAYHRIPETTEKNKIAIISTGEKAYRELMQLLDDAQETIEIQTYIIGNDEVGDAILQRLVEKAKAGVKIRLLVDGLFAFIYPKSKLDHLRKSGIAVSLFLPLRFRIFRSRVNLRNHRKLIIVDRKIAIMGGMNLAKNYMGPVKEIDRWCDIALSVQGESIAVLSQLFESDWHFSQKEVSNIEKPSIHATTSFTDLTDKQNLVQVVASGPDVKGDPFYNTLLTAIFDAEKSIEVITPYFVPDLALVRALTLAAFRDVNVTIIVPRHSNHPVADFARSRHIRELAAAGVSVLFFEPTMIHAKVITIDDSLAIVGSANFDMRSLFFNFESCVYLYSTDAVIDVKLWVKALVSKCSDKRYLKNPTKMRLLLENIALLIAPLL